MKTQQVCDRRRPTQRVVDVWDSARFQAFFYTLSFLRFRAVVDPPPTRH